jgi:hypothetical protein
LSVVFQRITPIYTKNIITGSIFACTKKITRSKICYSCKATIQGGPKNN